MTVLVAKVIADPAWTANFSRTESRNVPTAEGEALGEELGLTDGIAEGEALGEAFGLSDGLAVGEASGEAHNPRKRRRFPVGEDDEL
jgi:hypothetical protein